MSRGFRSASFAFLCDAWCFAGGPCGRCRTQPKQPLKTLLDELRPALLDPQAESLAAEVEWWTLPDLGVDDPFPVAVLGQGAPLLLLHGFDSSFLCLLYTSPSPRDATLSRMPSSA